MERKQQFNKVMSESVNMALATSMGDKPNVRIITFAYDEKKEGRVFFTTFKGNQKIKEFEKNSQVACMPLPKEVETDEQVRFFGTVRESDISMDEIVSMISKKYPEGADTISQGGDMMGIYEICFKEAFVTICMNEAQKLVF